MRHRSKNRISNAIFRHGRKIRYQIKGNTFHRSRRQQRMNGKDYHYDNQHTHHHFCYFFNTILQTKRTDKKGYKNSKNIPKHHRLWRRLHGIKCILNSTAIQTMKLSGQRTVGIIQNPSCHHRIKHHQHIKANNTQPFHMMKAAPLLLQFLISLCHTFLAGTSNRKFAKQNRQSQNHQKY